MNATVINLLIDAFPVPPFLLPIYQAAGIDYGVPWEVLAAINEIETDYGRNLSVSSAGAVGWMQFMPSTWARFGMDADGNGAGNPYDPVDAIFAAARYLHAAGAERNLQSAIFAYNHADWYVNSVYVRAKLLQYLPQGLVDGLTGLMQASYPVAGHLGAYATQAPAATRIAGRPAATLSGPAGAPVIAVADGRVVSLGEDARLGRYVTIEDSYGDRFTYSRLGRVESVYPVLKPRAESPVHTARQLASASVASRKAPLPAATASNLAGWSSGASGRVEKARTPRAPTPAPTPRATPMPKERLFANPLRPGSYAAGGSVQLQSSISSYVTGANVEVGGRGPADYFSQPVELRPGEFTLAPLTRGAVVVAGTLLGRVGKPAGSPGVGFQITPGGATKPVDPSAILAAWRVLGRLTAGRAALAGPHEAGAFGAANPTLGQLLMASKRKLERDVLSDPRVAMSRCDRSGTRAGLVDRRVLAVIEYLSYSRLAPGVSRLVCGQPVGFAPAAGTQLEISRLDGIPVAGHQQPGGIVDLAIRRLLGLQGGLRPSRIISLRSYAWESAALALPDHSAQIEVDFSPGGPAAMRAVGGDLNTRQWDRLIGRLAELRGQPATSTTAQTSLPKQP